MLVFAIAWGVVGREAHRLDSIAPRTLYIDAEAVDYVAALLSPGVQQRVTPEEFVRAAPGAHALAVERGLQPDRAVDQRQAIDRPVVMDDVGATGYLIGEAERLGIEVDDAAIAEILDGHLAYFDAIGAVGPTAQDPEVDLKAIGRPPNAGEVGPGSGSG